MSNRKLSRNEIGNLGSRIYREKLQAELESSSHGQFVAIDVESGEYEIASESQVATELLWARIPAAQVYVERVGFVAAFHAYSIDVGSQP